MNKTERKQPVATNAWKGMKAAVLAKPIIAALVLALPAATAQAQFAGNNQTITINGGVSNYVGASYYVGNSAWNDALIVTNSGTLSLTGACYVGYTTGTSTNNTITITGSGSVLTNSKALTIGNNGGYCQMTLTNGGTVYDTSGSIGVYSSNNTVVVTGPSYWTNSSDLTVGGNGAGNKLTIANGGAVYDFHGYMGSSSAPASNNTVLVTGTNSVWVNTNTLIVGTASSGNQLTITNGGTVYNSNGTIGSANTANSNAVLVTGAGSVWTNSGQITVGSGGISNQLTIADGGTVYGGNVYVGSTASGNSNALLVTGSGSVLNGSGGLIVGNINAGASNQMTIASGGTVYSASGSVGGGNSGGTNNVALVTGGGSVWSNSGQVTVGNYGAGNQLTITNGGGVYSTIAVIGSTVAATNNTVLVTGAGSFWSNSVDFHVGNSGPGNKLTIANGGTVYNGTTATIGSQPSSSNNTVFISGSGSVWRTTSTLTINTNLATSTGNGLIMSNGGVVAAAAGVVIGTGGYVTNYVSGISGGLDMAKSNATFTLTGNMSIIFSAAPPSLGPYWGLRWKGSNVTTLAAATNSGALTISDGPGLPAYWQKRARVYYDPATTNTYVGFNVVKIPTLGTIMILK